MSDTLTAEIHKVLAAGGRRRTMIITTGNSLRSDDGAGPYLASLLKGKVIWDVFDAGIYPESILDTLKLGAERIIFFDAADFGGTAGDVRVIAKECISRHTVSTHTVPINVYGDILQADTGAEIIYLGIQIASAALGENISHPVAAGCEKLAEFIIKEYSNA